MNQKKHFQRIDISKIDQYNLESIIEQFLSSGIFDDFHEELENEDINTINIKSNLKLLPARYTKKHFEYFKEIFTNEITMKHYPSYTKALTDENKLLKDFQNRIILNYILNYNISYFSVNNEKLIGISGLYYSKAYKNYYGLFIYNFFTFDANKLLTFLSISKHTALLKEINIKNYNIVSYDNPDSTRISLSFKYKPIGLIKNVPIFNKVLILSSEE